jgi:hypothetical protein
VVCPRLFPDYSDYSEEWNAPGTSGRNIARGIPRAYGHERSCAVAGIARARHAAARDRQGTPLDHTRYRITAGALLRHGCPVLAESATELRFEDCRSGTERSYRARSRRDGGVTKRFTDQG